MRTSVARGATWKVLLAGTLALALSTPAVASAEAWKWKWSNGFKLDSPDGDFKLKFGGRLMADYTFVDADDSLGSLEDGFEVRRARLFVSGTMYDRIEFKVNFDFAGGEAEAKDLYIGLKNDWGTVRFGHYKEYFSLEELTSSKYLAFLERSMPVEAFVPSRGSGVGIHGKSGDRFNWGVGYFFEADGFGDSTDEDNTNLTGRVAFRPIWKDGGKRMLHLGLSASAKNHASTIRYRNRPEVHLSSRLVGTPTFAADSTTLLDLEAAGVSGPFWFAGEFIRADVDAPLFGDPTFSGFDVQAGFYLTGEHRRFKTSSGVWDRQKPKSSWGKDGGKGAWELALRYSTIDYNDAGISGGEQDNVTVALNWYLNPATRMMINWVHADADDRGEADFLLVRWQVDF